MTFSRLFLALTLISGLAACQSSTVSGIGGGGGAGGSTGTGTGTSGGTGGDGGAGGGAPIVFKCGISICKLGVEYCKVQDSAGDTMFTCMANVPATCTLADLCSCPDLKPGCVLGDGPGAFTCSVSKHDIAVISCPG
jgi:hypothetical protein